MLHLSHLPRHDFKCWFQSRLEDSNKFLGLFLFICVKENIRNVNKKLCRQLDCCEDNWHISCSVWKILANSRLRFYSSVPLNITANLSPNGSQAMERTQPPTVTDSSSNSQLCVVKSAHLTASRAPFAVDVLFCPSPYKIRMM